MSRSTSALLSLLLLLAACPAEAQDMNIALSRLRITAEDPAVNPATECPSSFTAGGMALGRAYCQDNDAWARVMTQFAGSMMPPVLTPASTRGVRGIYVGFETWLTPIDNDSGSETGQAWFRAVEGDGMGSDFSRSRFVDNMLAWGRFNVRKGLPFGFELGTSVGYLANTTYWTLGLEVKWSLFEGFREDVGWIPDFAVRAAVQTLIGDGEFNVTVPSLDFILSEPFVVGNSVEIIPSIMGQVAWVFADSELVDLNPEVSAFDTCMPNPSTPDSGRPPYCRGDGMELNHNIVFPSLRSMRARGGLGLQIRYEWFAILASFLGDFLPPGELDGSLPQDDPSTPADESLPRQWQLDLGIGLTL